MKHLPSDVREALATIERHCRQVAQVPPVGDNPATPAVSERVQTIAPFLDQLSEDDAFFLLCIACRFATGEYYQDFIKRKKK